MGLWSGSAIINSGGFEAGAEAAEDRIDLTVYDERRVDPERSGELGYGNTVFEPKAEEESFLGREGIERLGEGAEGFGAGHPIDAGGGIVAGNLIECELVAHQVDEPASGLALFEPARFIALGAAVATAVVVEAEAPGNHDEPGREGSGTDALVAPQFPKVVAAESLDHEGVPVHHGVVATTGPASHEE